MRIPLVAGVDFAALDDPIAPAQTIVNEALGATARCVMKELVSQNLAVAVVGALCGWVPTLVVALDVVGVDTIGVSVFAGVPLLLLSIAAVACWIPASRAARVDPMIVLRDE